MADKQPDQLEEKKKMYKTRWTNVTNTYIQTKADSALGIDTSGQHARSYASIVAITKDITVFIAHLKGLIATQSSFLKTEGVRIQTIKTKYNNTKLGLTTELSNNNAGKPLKVDKYNENSKSYIYTSYYTIGILSISYFIYKQLKQ
jgi:hypothetical protein